MQTFPALCTLSFDEVFTVCKSLLVLVPGAAVTNDHKLGGLKHQKFILPQLRGPESKFKLPGRAVLLLKD